MSTRKLILLALACGMAILVAGSVQLLRIRHTSTTTLSVGDSTELATLTVRVVSGEVQGDALVVGVHLSLAASAAQPLTDALTGWSVLAGGLKKPVPAVAPTSAGVTSCGSLSLVPGSSADCSVAFPVPAAVTGTSFVTFRYVGEQATWSVGA